MDSTTKNVNGSARAFQIAGLALRLVIVPVLVAWLVFELASLGGERDWSKVNVPELLLGLAAYHVALILFAERMRTTLSLFEIQIPRVASFRICLQSIVYFFLVPMSLGIEISRYFKIRAIKPDLEFKWLAPAIFMDRLIGFASAVLFLIILGALLLPISLDNVTVVLAGAALMALAVICSLYAIRRYSGWLIEILHAVLRHPARTALPVLISIAMQFATGAGVCLCADSLGIRLDVFQAILGVSVSNIANVIPFSLLGAGASEAAGAAAFLSVGLDSREAVLLVAIMYSLKLIAALEGAAMEVYQGGIEAIRVSLR